MEHACTVEKTKREKDRQGMVQTYKDSLLLFQNDFQLLHFLNSRSFYIVSVSISIQF